MDRTVSINSTSLRLCAILLAGQHAAAAEPFAWKWAEGDSARYQLTQTTGMKVDAGAAGKVANTSRQDSLIVWVVDSVADEGPAQLRQATERIVIEHSDSMGQGFTYDSSDEDPPAGMAALIAPMFEAVIENDLLLAMLGSGEITEVGMTDELAEAFKRLPGGAISADRVVEMTKQSVLRFSAEPVEVGGTWTIESESNSPQLGPITVSTTYTYAETREVDGRSLEVFTPSIAIKPSQDGIADLDASIEVVDVDGEVLFDREAGRLHSSRLSQTILVRVKINDKEIANEVKQGVAMRLLGDAEGLKLPEKETAAIP